MPVVLTAAWLRGRRNARAMFHITRIKNCMRIKPISPSVMPARALFHLRELFYLASCFYLLVKPTPAHTHTHTHTDAHTHWQQIPMKCLNMVNKRSAGEWKEKRNKKQISNEIITIQREGGDRETEKERERVGLPQWRGTIAPRQWKKRGGGERAIWTIEPVTGAQWLQCFQLDIIS